MLRQVRETIRRAVPKAEERMSYGMPYYHYKGRLAYFRLARSHVGLYIPTPVLAEYKRELKKYETTDATLRLPLDAKLPLALIKRLVRSRAEKNDAKRRMDLP
jgi:uncharacterized protein YdhG (YjbR/CyaY superfamily)